MIRMCHTGIGKVDAARLGFSKVSDSVLMILGAAKLSLKIIALPARYREYTSGSTNISRWRHGLLLFRMVAFAARHIKFV
jgi:hypothetical protein